VGQVPLRVPSEVLESLGISDDRPAAKIKCLSDQGPNHAIFRLIIGTCCVPLLMDVFLMAILLYRPFWAPV